ncbi:small nuclear ribonucleoprotein 35kDa [Helicostylum pulchrum]|uniref:RRM domain-containing protein n=1 Tax=Helicostylum pulchrum TaxID=562976 RepID=A0ABP9Y8J2_9FUNG|nr:small nuclear ribonucleoprotein 35kDa [Helicostylum pulchrum]
MWYSKEYDPIQVGSIDGTDTDPHDAAIARATRSNYRPPRHLKTDPNNTLFISRLNFETTESTIKPLFEKYGKVTSVELIRNNVTGLSQGYAFVTFEDTKSTREAYKDTNETVLDDHVILVDYERSRGMVGWIPRRFGGGYGGKKESGQLRFGARDRPFRDNHGKVNVPYEQKRSDVWRKDESGSSKRSSERSDSRHDRHDSSRNDRSHRSSRRRSVSPEHRSTRRRTSDSSRHHSDSKRKRQESSRSSRDDDRSRRSRRH